MVSWEAVHSSSLMDGGLGAACGGNSTVHGHIRELEIKFQIEISYQLVSAAHF